ncbi:DUF2330 domain-containing protein [Candidatus Poribacteria bacterium]|nr:DUF2330 domain-containing protein [Candidatus Poribacteria bacterium]
MKNIFCLLISIAIILIPFDVDAYVMVFYRDYPVIYEISHRSIIIYDRENQKVGLVPQISFRGSPKDFCIVVPTPTPPRLNTVNRDVFYEAEYLTNPVWRQRGSGCMFGSVAEEDSDVAEEPGVDIIDEQTVGEFNGITLSADDPDALINWLEENNYNYSVHDKDIVDYYIQRGWFFTVVRIDGKTDPGMSEYYRYNINPILFRYSASSLIYPLRLSSINSGDRTSIEMYIISDTKMTFPGSRIEYANRMDEDEIKSIIDRFPAFGGLIGQYRYLTKLKRTFSILEMEEDIEIVPASDDKEFKQIIYNGVSSWIDFIPLGVFIFLFVVFRKIYKRFTFSKI